MTSAINHGQPAVLSEVRPIVELLASSVPEVSVSTIWQVPWNWQHYRVSRTDDGNLVGCAGLIPQSANKAEIRGVSVARTHRSLGIASALVGALLKDAASQGIETVCVTRCPEFFERFGFRPVSPPWLNLGRAQVAAMRQGVGATQTSHDSRITMRLEQWERI